MLIPEAMLQKGEDENAWDSCVFSSLRKSLKNECADLLTLPVKTALPTAYGKL